jgi:predicted DNA repair protein MutK
MKWLVRGSIPIAAILVPAAFFLSVLSPDAKAPNGLIYLAYVGALLLALGVLRARYRPRQAAGTSILKTAA